MEAKNNLIAVGAALLPAVVTNAVCADLDREIHKDEWQEAAPVQHHVDGEAPASAPGLADVSAMPVGGIPPVRIEVPGTPFALEDDSGFIALESGDGLLLSEPRRLVATVG